MWKRALLAAVLLSLSVHARADWMSVSPAGGGATSFTIGGPLIGCGTSGYVLYNNGNLVGCENLAGGGNVINSGTPTVGQLGVWVDATHLQGVTTGTGVVTALGVAIGSAGAPVVFNGALGTPSSGVATNLTGTAAGLTAGTASAVAVGGITGLGTGVGTALAINVGSAGAPVLFGGSLGTPSSGVATNLTGTAAGLTAGNVTTDANLTGVITSSGNATSTGAQTGTGNTFVMSVSPTVTGSFTATGLITAADLFATSGSGSVVLTTSPTLVTPALGTPTSGVATNLTGTAAGLTAGIANALNSATTTVVVNAATAPTSGQVLTASSGTAAAWVTPSAGGWTAPTTGYIVVANGTSPTGLAPVNGDCVVGSGGAWTVGSCLGGGAVSGPGSSTSGYVPQWSGTSGTSLSVGLPVGLTGNSTIVETTSGGLITASLLPLPTASTLGGIESITSASHEWVSYIDTSGVPHQSQPACGDLSNSGTACQDSTGTTSGTVPILGSGGLLAASTVPFGTAANQAAQGGVIIAGGPTGSATVAPVITYNAAGQLTAVTSATITPAIGSVTGLGTGVGTSLGTTAVPFVVASAIMANFGGL